ncbi:MAG TPA: carboxylating nicotinate-nucleotide diphosphorylase [Candidatus Omnitrophica bacterium]|nr:carboxylating nicotinate-nucleotide diphosphorylase [Candidatus Omnitrophota bacterium]
MCLSKEIEKIIKCALKEDLTHKDITTILSIPKNLKIKGIILAREKGILCGVEIAKKVFTLENKKVIFKSLRKDGDVIKKNEKIALIEGDAYIILSRERVALNFLSFLSGISTITKKFVEKVKNTPVLIYDTRKTFPNLRSLEKYAVKMGGGFNHRKNLVDFVLIKDNHLKALKFRKKNKLEEEKFKELMLKIRKTTSLKVEMEVETFKEFKMAIKYKPDIIMLDNFRSPLLKKSVAFRNKFYPQVKLEASGGINLKNVKKVAKTGVDFISIGAITHSPKSLDFSLEIT